MKLMYHATPYENIDSVKRDGLLANNGRLFLCDNPADAAGFLVTRGIAHILVCEAEVPESELTESFEHNSRYFGCRAFYITHGIGPLQLRNLYRYILE